MQQPVFYYTSKFTSFLVHLLLKYEKKIHICVYSIIQLAKLAEVDDELAETEKKLEEAKKGNVVIMELQCFVKTLDPCSETTQDSLKKRKNILYILRVCRFQHCVVVKFINNIALYTTFYSFSDSISCKSYRFSVLSQRIPRYPSLSASKEQIDTSLKK